MMQRHNTIIFLFFLSIFSMFILHQVLPHVHHEHNGLESSITYAEGHHQSHEKEHHHHNEDGDDNDFDFLGFLIGNHTHGVQADNIPSVKNVISKQVVSKIVSYDALPNLPLFPSTVKKIEKSKVGYSPPDVNIKIVLSTSFSRGPPSVG